eukprot:264422-Rhodomonas_salina.2
MVQREEPARVPVASLESGATGFVRRDMNCPDCRELLSLRPESSYGTVSFPFSLCGACVSSG